MREQVRVTPIASPRPSSVAPRTPSREGEEEKAQRFRRHLPMTDPEELAAVEHTLDLIESSGPFPYRQDGVVFLNREGRLPGRGNGYYHEYTVRVPGERTRGARRIVQGELPTTETFYTRDHYRTFMKIDPRRSP